MALTAWDKTRVYATWFAQDGERLAGSYRVTMPVRVTIEDGEAIVPAGVYAQGDLNVANPTSPALDVMVPANNDPDVTPAGWQVTVEVTLTMPNSQRVTEKYVIDTPVDGEVNLRTIPLTQTIPPHQTMLLRGVAGGVAGLDSDGDVIDADGNKVVGGGGGDPLTSYATQVATLTDYPTVFPADLSDTATAAQGALADTAVQPGDLGTAAATDATAYATAAQGATADTAVQPAAIADFITAADVPAAPTWDTIAGKPAVVAEGTSQTAARAAIGAGTSNLQLGTGATTAAAGDHNHTGVYATAAQGALADTAVQPAAIAEKFGNVTSFDYGTTLPGTGNEGDIFFLIET